MAGLILCYGGGFVRPGSVFWLGLVILIKGYKDIIQLVSKILRNKMSNTIVANSFFVSGITQNDELKYHLPLRWKKVRKGDEFRS